MDKCHCGHGPKAHTTAGCKGVVTVDAGVNCDVTRSDGKVVTVFVPGTVFTCNCKRSMK